MKLFELYKYGKENKIWDWILLVISLITVVVPWFINKINIYMAFSSVFLIILILINIIYKEKSLLKFIISIIPLISIYLNFKDFYDLLSFIIILYILTFSAWCIYQAYYLFGVIWKKDIFKIHTDWESLNFKYFVEHQLRSVYIILIIVSGSHALYAFTYYNKEGVSLGFIHQLMIFLLTFLLIVYSQKSIEKLVKSHVSKLEKIKLFRESVGRLMFLTFIIYFVFDSLLVLYALKDNNFKLTPMSVYLFTFNFIFLYFAFKSGEAFKKRQEGKVRT